MFLLKNVLLLILNGTQQGARLARGHLAVLTLLGLCRLTLIPVLLPSLLSTAERPLLLGRWARSRRWLTRLSRLLLGLVFRLLPLTGLGIGLLLLVGTLILLLLVGTLSILRTRRGSRGCLLVVF